MTDALGNVTTYTYYSNGLVESVTLPDPDGTTGPQTAPVTSLLYDTRGRLTQITHPDSTTHLFEYDTADNLTKVTDELGRITTFTYNDLGQRTSVTDANNKTTTYVWHGHHLESETDPLGNTTSYGYDSRERLTTITYADPDGAGSLTAPVVRYGYDGAGNLTSQTDPLGNVTTYTHDRDGRLLTETLPDPDGTAGPLTAPVTTYGHDALGRMTSVTDALGRVSRYEYDARDRLTKVTQPDPDGSGAQTPPVTTYSYDEAGNLLSVSDPLGRVTTYEYDALGRPTAVIQGSAGASSEVQILDDGDAGFSTSGSWTRNTTQGYQTDIHYSAKGTGADVAQWSFAGLAAGTYRVSATWYPHSNRATDSPFTVLDGSTALGTVRVNQELTPNDFNDAGVGWEDLGEFTISGDTLVVKLSDDANEYVIADAIRIERLDPPPTTRWAYDGLGNLLTETDPLGNVTTHAYDVMGRLAKLTGADPDGSGAQTPPVTTYSYDAAGNLTAATDALGRVTAFEYDALNRQTAVTQKPAASGSEVQILDDGDAGFTTSGSWTRNTTQGYQTDIHYSAKGTGADVAQWTFAGLAAGTYRVSATWYPHSNRATDSPFTVLDGGTALGTVRVNQELTPNDFNDAGVGWEDLGEFTISGDTLVVKLSDDANEYVIADAIRIERLDPTYTTTYDAVGNVLTETDPLGNTTTHAYDNLGRLTSTTDARNGVRSFAYDRAGRLTSVTDPTSRTTSYDYDNLGRRTTVTLPDPDGTGALAQPVYTTGYDAVGNVISQTDALSQTTSYAYDGLNRLTSSTDARNGVTRYAYDGVGNLTSLTDPVNNTTTWAYDELDRVISETNSLGKARTYVYDVASNLTKATDRNGRVREYSYDNLHRQTEERWLEGANVVNTIAYNYDAASQLLSAGDAFSSYAYEYDQLGRLVEVDNAGTPGAPQVVLANGYDIAGRRTSVAATVNGTADYRNAYQYDALGRMTRIEQSGQAGGNTVAQKRVDLAYNAAGQFDTIARYADLAGTMLVATSTHGYDGIGRLTALAHAKGANTLADYSFTFDAASRITSVTGPDGTSTYAYDTTDQLTGADHSYQTDEAYSYDLNGNRTNTGYQTDTNNLVLSDGTHTYQYDGEGNRSRKTAIDTGDYVEYEWDHRNRLTAVTFKTSGGTTSKRVEYTYDVNDLRIAKHVDEDADGLFDRSERYVYDGTDLVLVYDESGSLENRYLYGPAMDQLFADENALGTVLWSLTDHQGTVRDLVEHDSATDTTSVVNHIQYDSFGMITGQTNSAAEPRLSYTGQEWDADAGLYYYNSRWYDAVLHQFVSEDWVTFHAGDTNLRRYVGNSPTNYTDPTGFNQWPAVFQIPGLEPAMSLDEIARMAQDAARRRPARPMGDRFGLMPDGSVPYINGNIDPIVLQQMQDGGRAPVFCVPADFSRLRDRPAAPPGNSEYDWVAVETASMAPVVGEVRDWGEAISGYDIYGNPLSWWERGATAALGMVPYVPGSWGRGAMGAIGRYGDSAAEWARAWWRRSRLGSLDGVLDDVNERGLSALQNAGNRGTSECIREFPGVNPEQAREFFDRISRGGNVRTSTPNLVVVEMPDGTFLTFRPAGRIPNRRTGIAPPTIDVNIPGRELIKGKFLPY